MQMYANVLSEDKISEKDFLKEIIFGFHICYGKYIILNMDKNGFDLQI